jgi:hypothetical protein
LRAISYSWALVRGVGGTPGDFAEERFETRGSDHPQKVEFAAGILETVPGVAPRQGRFASPRHVIPLVSA